MNFKLYKSDSDKKICGVCGGLAELTGLDVTLLRVLWACSAIFAGGGLWVYIVCAILFPKKEDVV